MSSPRPLRAARYIRVSRLDQNTALQADETKDFCSRRGWELVDTYTDHGVSGAKERRPQLDRLLADAHRRKFDVLLVWRSDRLFRSLRQMVTTLHEFSSLGIAFTSVTEVFDTSTPSGTLLLHLVSAMSEFERSILVERVRSGVAAARRRGVRLGRKPAELDVDHVRELRGKGMSVRQIAETLGVGSSTVQRRLATGGAA